MGARWQRCGAISGERPGDGANGAEGIISGRISSGPTGDGEIHLGWRGKSGGLFGKHSSSLEKEVGGDGDPEDGSVARPLRLYCAGSDLAGYGRIVALGRSGFSLGKRKRCLDPFGGPEAAPDGVKSSSVSGRADCLGANGRCGGVHRGAAGLPSEE